MDTVTELFTYQSAEIEEAASETDTTVIELLAAFQKVFDNESTSYTQSAKSFTDSFLMQADAMLEYLKENNPDTAIERATAEAEYHADAAQDEAWLKAA